MITATLPSSPAVLVVFSALVLALATPAFLPLLTLLLQLLELFEMAVTALAVSRLLSSHRQGGSTISNWSESKFVVLLIVGRLRLRVVLLFLPSGLVLLPLIDTDNIKISTWVISLLTPEQTVPALQTRLTNPPNIWPLLHNTKVHRDLITQFAPPPVERRYDR